jgi:quinohemoprotein ethanol dehydrogenase
MRQLAGVGSMVLLTLAGAGALADALPFGAGAAADWPGPGGAADESGYSQLDTINRSSVGRLGLAWSLDLPGEVTLEATPLAVGGTLYFSGTYSTVYAVDAATGKLRWKYDPEIWKHDPARMSLNFAVNRGVAYERGRVFVASFDGRLMALDARTGKLLWSARTLAPDTLYFSTGAPRVFNGKVIIGNGGGDFGSRGYVTAFDSATGRQLWRFYTVPGSPEQNRGDSAMERAAATWSGQYWKTGTGGTVWNGITFDPEMDRVYIGTGNSGPYDPAIRSPGDGDNLYLVSIVALDADTGKYIWHYQMNPREAWDYKATANIIASTLMIDGQPRKVLLQSPTNGFFYVIDRVTGKLISAEKTGKVTWAERIDLATGRPVERKNIRYETGATNIWPSPVGTHNWQAMSYSPKTGLAYIPYMQAGARFSRGVTQPGDVSVGGLNIGWVVDDPQDGTAALLAWNPLQQKAAWKIPLPTFWNGGTLATAGDLVFQGTADGMLSAYDAVDGRKLWRFNAGLGIEAPPISYSAGGRQYVSILVGYGGSASMGGDLMNMGWKYGAQPRRLLTFALDGRARLPPTASPDKSVTPVDDPALQIRAEDVQAGHAAFLACALCHGRDGVSGGTAPDLRESRIALNLESLWAVVHDGVLMQRGMPRYDDLSREQLRQIQAYIRAGARAALDQQRKR